MEKTINLNCNFAQTDSVDTQKRINLYQKKLINKRVLDFGCGSGSFLSRIKKENMQIVREIERMQTDTAYQKKLVRDNLGFIAADEFLILFPKEKSVQ